MWSFSALNDRLVIYLWNVSMYRYICSCLNYNYAQTNTRVCIYIDLSSEICNFVYSNWCCCRICRIEFLIINKFICKLSQRQTWRKTRRNICAVCHTDAPCLVLAKMSQFDAVRRKIDDLIEFHIDLFSMVLSGSCNKKINTVDNDSTQRRP